MRRVLGRLLIAGLLCLAVGAIAVVARPVQQDSKDRELPEDPFQKGNVDHPPESADGAFVPDDLPDAPPRTMPPVPDKQTYRSLRVGRAGDMPPGDDLRKAADVALPGLPDLPWDAFGRGDDIKPLPPQEIPDNPPPHEGAMIEVQQTVEPPDLLIVEVLTSAIGRPITGERLVRPNGTITLGWYGDVHVRGLTVPQIKRKIIIHLRKFLADEALGLLAEDQHGDIVHVPPEESDTVFVDIAAYNHDVYYVEGDVNKPGRLPITGNETVIDALAYCGYEAPVGNSKDVVLVRPSREGRPARTFSIDVDAIRRKGDATANLQLFPGDRLVVGRIPIVTETINIDRVAAPTNTLLNTMLQYAFVLKNLREQMDAAKLTPEQRTAMTEAWLTVWSDWTKRGPFETPTPDELRDVFKKLLEPTLVPADAN